MSLSEFYESTILKARASFRFFNFEYDPDEITKAMGFDPDRIDRKGKIRQLPSGRESEMLFNIWEIDSQGESKDINDHLRMILRRIEGKQKRLKPEFGPPSFDVLWKCNYLYAGSGPFYEPDVIAGIASWGAILYQDIYQVDQDDSEISSKSMFERIPRSAFGP